MMHSNIGAGVGVLLFRLRQERRKLFNEIVQENNRIMVDILVEKTAQPAAPKKPSSSVESISGSDYLSWSMISSIRVLSSPEPPPEPVITLPEPNSVAFDELTGVPPPAPLEK